MSQDMLDFIGRRRQWETKRIVRHRDWMVFHKMCGHWHEPGARCPDSKDSPITLLLYVAGTILAAFLVGWGITHL